MHRVSRSFAEMTVRAGRPVHTITTIMDMESMSLKMMGAVTRNYIAAMIGIDKEHYPETLGRMVRERARARAASAPHALVTTRVLTSSLSRRRSLSTCPPFFRQALP